MFRTLDEEEKKQFKKWARDNYVPGEEISEVWHPVVREECARMNEGPVTVKKVSDYVLDTWRRFGAHPLGHAYFWAMINGKKECIVGVPGCADLEGLRQAVKDKFDLETVWYNLD